MVDMNKRIYDSGSLQGFNVVSQMYPSGAGCKGFCGGGSMESISYSYGEGDYMASSARWYEISWCSAGVGVNGKGFYEGVVCRGCTGIPDVVADGVIGYVGTGIDIDVDCDGLIVDRILMEWRVMVEGLNGMG